VGSSSSSYIMLELLAGGHAPAAVLVPEPDAILSLGVIVAREMGYASMPVVQLTVRDQRALPTDVTLHLAADGGITVVP
jgi:predicted aconitase with swiveling domain